MDSDSKRHAPPYKTPAPPQPPAKTVAEERGLG